MSEGVGRCRGPTETARPPETARLGLERPPEYGRGPRPPEYGSRSGGARCHVYRSGGRRGGERWVASERSCVAGATGGFEVTGGFGVRAVAMPHLSGRGEWPTPEEGAVAGGAGAMGGAMGGAGATGGALVEGGAAAAVGGEVAAAAAVAALRTARVRARPLSAEAEAEAVAAVAAAGGHPQASDGVDQARGPRSRTRVSEHQLGPLSGGAAAGGEGRAFTCCTCENVGR